MDKEQFLTIMKEEVLDMDTDITMDTSLSNIEEWDSLAWVNFIAMTNTSMNKNVDRSALQKATKVSDLYLLLQ